jgi:DNA-binding FadR family transcriptional regulator
MEILDKASLTEQAVEAIKRQILTQHLRPGDRLPPERQLCESLGISRSILREALSALVSQGIVGKVPGKGVYIQDFDRRSLGVHIRLTITDQSELGALKDLRTMLEVGALELVAQRSTVEELDQLEGIIAEMEQRLHRRQPIGNLDYDFHLSLFGAAHAPALLPLYEQVLRDVTDLTVFQNPQVRDTLTPETGLANLSFLRQVLSALRRRDVGAAHQAIVAHISLEPARLDTT